MTVIRRHVKAVIQFRRAKESEWIDCNPVLRAGEPALSTDIMKVKVGDGVTSWINLDYIDNTQDEITFVKTLEGLVGRENRLYIKTTDATAYIWEDGGFTELESSSIEDLKHRVSTNEIAIAELQEEIAHGADKNFIYKQQTASDTWVIDHNLGKYPSITVVDSGGSVVVGEITLLTINQAVISFSGAFSGTAYCN